MTTEEKSQIDRVFPQGHDEIDVPTYIRNRDKEDIARVIQYEKQILDKLLEEETFRSEIDSSLQIKK